MGATDPVQQAVDIARLQEQMVNQQEHMTRLTDAVNKLTEQVTALVQAQVGAKWLGGAVVYLVPIVSAIISALAYFKAH